MPNASDDLPNEEQLREVRAISVALSIMDQVLLQAPPPLTLSDLVAFLCGSSHLSVAGQEYLYSNERMQSEFRALVQRFRVPRIRRTVTGFETVSEEHAHLPVLAAAASEDDVPRIIPGGGGSAKIYDFGENERLLEIILNKGFTLSPRFLLLEDHHAKRLARIKLTNPEPSFSAGLNFIKRTDVPEDVHELQMLKNPSSKGNFLR
jgi:hypothetical protein